MKFDDVLLCLAALSTCFVAVTKCDASPSEPEIASNATLVDANSTSISGGDNETARFSFNPPQIPMDGLFPQFSNNPEAATDGQANPFPGFPLVTALAVAKGGLVAILSLVKAALPQALFVGVILALLALGVAAVVCTFTDCSRIGVGGGVPWEPEFYNRNAYDSPIDYRHVYQGIDEHKYKYNQINHEKEYSSGI